MDTSRIYYSREAERRVARERLALTLMCVLFGLGMGSVLALLFAPTTGKKTRDDITHTVESGVKSGRDRIEPAIGQIEHEISVLRKKVEERLS